MKALSAQTRLQRELKRLFRSMDFVSRHPALEKDGRDGEQLAEVYQQLGLVWEFLALQCAHWDGFRNTREGKRVCKICGTVEGAEQSWMLLPRKGRKSIGRKSMPTTTKTLANRNAATVLDDTIDFHGAKLRVIVQNAYRSKLFRNSDVTIAADRMVRLEEGGVEIRFDTHMISLRLVPREPGRGLPRGAFPWELTRERLKRFPVMFEYDEAGQFVGLSLFKPQPAKLRRAGRAARRRKPEKNDRK